MPKIEIKCPLCKKNGVISIEENLVKSSSRGLLSVHIANDIICEHTFTAYIDKNLQIRDYFFVDFSVKLPEISLIENLEQESVLPKEVVDIDLIKLNIPAITLAYILKSIFLKQKIVLIFNQEFLYHHIEKFFEYITQNSFEMDFSLINSNDYKNNKKSYKDAMVFESNKIIRNNKNLINPKKLDIEKKIIERFYSESELGYSYIVLKNEIFKAYELSLKIIQEIEKVNKIGNQPNILVIQDELEKIYKVKIDKLYLNFLIDIIANYFEVKVPSLINGLFEFL
ncbi:MAG: hypothetical protein ACFFDK_09900 [Promethearchaeota archaeon]